MKIIQNIISTVVLMTVCTSVWAVDKTIKLTVDGMVCAFCAQGIEKKLRAQKETAALFISLEKKIVAIATRDGADIPDARLTELLRDAGYDVKAIARVAQSLDEIRAEAKRK